MLKIDKFINDIAYAKYLFPNYEHLLQQEYGMIRRIHISLKSSFLTWINSYD